MLTEKSDGILEEREGLNLAKVQCEQIFNAVSDLIIIVDNNLTIMNVNRAMAERCGMTPKELEGRKCFEVMHGTESPPESCPHTKLLLSGECQNAEFTVEKLHGVFDVRMSPVFNSEGQLITCIHIARDITEKKRQEGLLAIQQKQLEEINSNLETRINDAVTELRKKDDILIQQSRLTAMGEMISAIAHQWRQPLNNIGLIVQSLQLAFKANDLTVQELNEDVADTMNILRQISETIDDFSNFFSYEEESSPFVVNDLVSRALSFVESALKKRGIRVELDVQDDITATGYPNEYVQALLNIILNARDVLLNNRTSPLITIRIFEENGRAIVTVRDNGGGISEANLPKIFDPYFTTKNQSTGAGIGLYMAKMVFEKKMHGSLTARNVDGGAEFRIEM
ncbi:MAG: PAS domain-containing protein [Proteobacteria bacterium]|nr:PAS domain-containing protein [Pseudomonadota bacterium]